MAQFLIQSLAVLKQTVIELDTHERLALDTETKGPEASPDVSGLYPFHGARAFSVIIATAMDEYYFDFNTTGMNPRYISELQPLFNNPKRIVYFVNASFDNTILHFSGIKILCRIIDAPSIARIEYNRHGKQQWADESFLSMEYLAEYYEVKLKDDRVKQYITEHKLWNAEPCRFTGKPVKRYDLVPLDLMFEYGCGDGRTTYDLCTKILKCINQKDMDFEVAREAMGAGLLMDVARNEVKLTTALIDMKIEGMEVDVPYVKEQIEIESVNLWKLTNEVKKLTGDINLNSGKQLAEYLIKQGVEVPRNEPTPTMLLRAAKWGDVLKNAKNGTKQYKDALEKSQPVGNYITDKKMLVKLMEKYPHVDFLSKVTKAKETEKKINTYYKNFLLFMDSRNFIHANSNQEKAVTGRFSMSDPNLQNLHKKDKSVKRAFRNTDPDFDWFYIDFKQQEMMVMLDQSDEMQVIYKLIDKVFDDFYLATQDVLLNITGLFITRDQAKAIALGLAYGQGIALLAKNLGVSLEQAKNFKAQFFVALPELKKFQAKLESQVWMRGKLHNPFGRVCYIERTASYKALNAFIQSTSADITKRAMVAIHEHLLPFKSRLLLSIHDELIFKIHKSERHLITEIQRLMSEAYPHKHIPLGSDVQWSPNNTSWGDKVDYIPEAA